MNQYAQNVEYCQKAVAKLQKLVDKCDNTTCAYLQGALDQARQDLTYWKQMQNDKPVVL